MRIAWIYEDDEYNERLSEYVRTNKEITIGFSFFQHYSDFVNRTDRFDFIFLEYPDISLVNSSYPLEKLVCITHDSESRFGEFTHLNIYQNTDRLFLDINHILNDRKIVKLPVEIHREKAMITAIYSASGGAGKTLFSKHISKIYMENKEKVLLVNLEMYSGNKNLLGEPSLSELILLIKLNEKFNDPIPLKKYTATLNGIETIPSFLHPSDAINISENDIFNLILLLSPIYDRIVFDLDVELSPRVLAVFNNCDELIEVMQDHESGINKHLQLMSILKDINVSQKHKIYISRHYTALFDDIEYLTEVREWYKLQI
jgi:MinD-like ATPase involved in chromosome partitioning or flagellar assembly